MLLSHGAANEMCHDRSSQLNGVCLFLLAKKLCIARLQIHDFTAPHSIKGVFGLAVAMKKAVVGCDL
jgi:hypothetical protein